MKQRRLEAAWCAIALVLAACSSESGSPATRYGTILLESNSGVEPTHQATGFFYRYGSTPVSSRCFVAGELDACRLWQCDDYAAERALDIVPVSAGTVSVTGAKIALSLEEGEAGSYSWADTLNSPLWSGGERLSLQVSGSDAFPAATTAVIAPEPITLTAPVVPSEPWQLDSSASLAFGWTAAKSGDVYVAISVAVPSPEGGANVLFPGVDCAFLGTAGASVVPASVLAELPKPEGIAGHQVEVLTFASSAVRVNDALLSFQATSFALSALATIE